MIILRHSGEKEDYFSHCNAKNVPAVSDDIAGIVIRKSPLFFLSKHIIKVSIFIEKVEFVC